MGFPSGMDIVSLDLDVFLFKAGFGVDRMSGISPASIARILLHVFCKRFIDRKHHLWMLLRGHLWPGDYYYQKKQGT